jgi:hypothetical protein
MPHSMKLVIVIEKGMLDEVRTDLATPNAFDLEVIDMDSQDVKEDRAACRAYTAAKKMALYIIYP